MRAICRQRSAERQFMRKLQRVGGVRFLLTTLIALSAVFSLQRGPVRASGSAGHAAGAINFPKSHAAASSKQLAQVRAIKRGLSVRPPKKKSVRGKVKQALFEAYLL